MDTALQKLGPGIEPADRAVWGTAHPLPVKEKSGTLYLIKTLRPYSIGISSIARNSHPYSGGRVWAEPTDRFPADDA